MLVGATGAAQLAWYDRRVDYVHEFFNANVGGTARTERVAYTVPAGVAFMIDEVSLSISTPSSGVSTSVYQCIVEVDHDSGGFEVMWEIQFEFAANNPASTGSVQILKGMILQAGDVITIDTVNGAAINVFSSLHVTGWTFTV